MSVRPYGWKARLGIGPPQANPTVEPEITALLPRGVATYVTRLTSRHESARDRLIDYLRNLDASLERFDTLQLDAFGFGCTGSTYLLGAEEERRIVSSVSEARGYPVITCAMAIVDALKFLGARRLALYSPYPEWLHVASEAYWRSRGFEIVATESINVRARDTREIYVQDPQKVADAILGSKAAVDISLITGTGLPSLGVIDLVAEASEKVVLSSNLCLAWRLLRESGVWRPPADRNPAYPLLQGWQV